MMTIMFLYVLVLYMLKDLKNANGWLIYSIGNLIIEILDTDYKDIDSLCNLDITNMMWKTSVLVKNYVTECVQIYNWWSQWQMYQI